MHTCQQSSRPQEEIFIVASVSNSSSGISSLFFGTVFMDANNAEKVYLRMSGGTFQALAIRSAVVKDHVLLCDHTHVSGCSALPSVPWHKN
jgi:hypothetical protein